MVQGSLPVLKGPELEREYFTVRHLFEIMRFALVMTSLMRALRRPPSIDRVRRRYKRVTGFYCIFSGK